ncbi:hypothetical protein IC235_03865 [Hymenobacter sp. BT664]|uniref:Uncharacterized protein n=1 Tax=Hymenobacter montanus TaxID=2771359 RepID=A0A927BBB6_9BACT|nr:hypothetical protein [Hymenobacter montanus]MBD2767029.1 hypothetical protein [Hymenobacter montanus]
MFWALLLAVLGGCTIFHPYRLPTPKPSPEFLAQQKAKKAKEKKNRQEMREEIRGNKRSLLALGRRKKKNGDSDDDPVVEAATDAASPTAGPAPASAVAPTAAPEEARTLPERATVRYDKQGLMKKPKLMRRRVHKPAGQPFRPWKAIRHFFKFNLHAKPNYSPDHRPAAPVPAAEPDAAPGTAPDSKP